MQAWGPVMALATAWVLYQNLDGRREGTVWGFPLEKANKPPAWERAKLVGRFTLGGTEVALVLPAILI